jgi:serine/threonine protein kinase
MATDEQPPKPLFTDNQDTALLGNVSAPPGGTLLKDRYLLVRQLSEGGFGTVHLARDQQMHGREVVVKIQTNQKVDDPWFERKFDEEVRALSMIDHPGIVVAMDSGRTPDGKPFLVMQYVDGVTLRAVMDPEGMPLDRAAGILKQVGHALAAAHEKGIWHRDLKPENLMLQSSAHGGERVRLIDFGIATVADIRSKYQTSTRVAGSVQYMAPEQSLGQPSAQTDIYAMGLIAYEMVTGRRPFMAENAVQLAALQRSPVRVRPSDLRPTLPAQAERLILQSLEYEPAKRPRNAREFGDQLHDAMLSAEVTRLSDSITEPIDEKGKKRKIWRIAVAIIIASGVLYQSRTHRPPARKTATVTKEAPAQDAAAERAVELAFWDSVKDSREPQLYREYLAKYPDGRFASLANAELAILARKETAKPVAAKTESPKPVNQAHEDEVEMAFWNSVKDSSEPQLYQDYLDKYPHGRFESLARTKLDILHKKGQGRHGRGPLDMPIPGMPDLGNLAGVDPKMAAELSEWNALRDARGPQPYRDYLAKYPNGMFASVARLKIASFDKKAGAPDFPPTPPDRPDPDERHRMPPPRPAISPDEYSGPPQGELRWSGAIPKNHMVVIQGGTPNIGTLTNDLPRVPVTVESDSREVSILERPSPRNNWDRIVIRNRSDSPGFVIRWKVEK